MNTRLSILIFLILFNCKEKSKEQKEKVSSENWIQLFNGTDLKDWIIKINGYEVGENAFNTFRVENGVLKVSYDEYSDFGELYGHIFYKKPFSNYKLRLEYRFIGKQAPGGESWATKNSGVMLHSQSPESMEINQGFPVSLEAQFLGGIIQGEDRPTANLCTPGTHATLKNNSVTDHCINSTSKTFYDDSWIKMEALVLNDSLITHSINGVEVIRYTKPIIGGEYLPENKNWKLKEGQPLNTGYIALQSESHPIEFKNIELLELE